MFQQYFWLQESYLGVDVEQLLDVLLPAVMITYERMSDMNDAVNKTNSPDRPLGNVHHRELETILVDCICVPRNKTPCFILRTCNLNDVIDKKN